MLAAWTRRLGAMALALGLGSGCASAPPPIQYDSRGGAPATADGLYRVRATRVGAAFVKPGARFADYEGVVIDPVSVSYETESRRSVAERQLRGSFLVGEDALERLKRIFRQSFERELARSRAFRVVSEAEPGALRLSGRIQDLSVDVPRWRDGERSFVVDAGRMTLVLEVRDAHTGEPLARVADRRVIRPSSSGLVGTFENNPVNKWGAVREIFADWARALRYGLEDLHTRPLPPAPGPQPQAP